MEWIFFVGVLVFAAAVIGGTCWYEANRGKKIRAAAESLGLVYAPGDDGLLSRLGMLPLFTRGRSRRIRNVLTGQIEDMAVHLFDYRYRTGSGKHSQTHNQTVAAFRLERAQLPKFTLAPEHWGHRLLSALGYQDIDFDDHPEFSRAFILRGDAERRIRDLFDGELLRFMLEHTGNTVEGATDWVVIYQPRKRVSPDALNVLMERGFLIASNVSLAAMRRGMVFSMPVAATNDRTAQEISVNPAFTDRA